MRIIAVNAKLMRKKAVIFLKTRNEIYSDEKEIIRIMSSYKLLHRSQLHKLFPNKKSGTVDNMLRKLARGKRLFINWETGYVAAGKELFGKMNTELVCSFWLLLEFIEKVTYHTTTEFPAQIFFITENDNYEILYVAQSQEAAVNAYFLKPKQQDICKRLVIVEDTAQIPNLNIPSVTAYTTVTVDGKISYYQY